MTPLYFHFLLHLKTILLCQVVGVLKTFVQAASLLLVARTGVKAHESGNSGEVKSIIIYLIIMSAIDVLEKSPVGFVFEAVPFWAIIKAIFLFMCSTPASGISMRVYDTVAKPFFGAGGKFASAEAKAASAPEPPKGAPKVAVVVKTASSVPPGDVYAVLVAKDGAEVGFQLKTSVSSSGKWGETVCLPKPKGPGELTVELWVKETVGSDRMVGSGSCSLDGLGPQPKAVEVALGSECGTISVDLSVA